MALFDESMQKMLEGKFGSRLEAATQATVQLRASIDQDRASREAHTRVLERLDNTIQELIQELRRK